MASARASRAQKYSLHRARLGAASSFASASKGPRMARQPPVAPADPSSWAASNSSSRQQATSAAPMALMEWAACTASSPSGRSPKTLAALKALRPRVLSSCSASRPGSLLSLCTRSSSSAQLLASRMRSQWVCRKICANQQMSCSTSSRAKPKTQSRSASVHGRKDRLSWSRSRSSSCRAEALTFQRTLSGKFSLSTSEASRANSWPWRL
mmetsp:Transcript_5657/g.13305  ORF Transcript_5657/g.13305 Transcript_5657/m.13305 type:complete len:210 (+) Transcript_5657:315-944(+)